MSEENNNGSCSCGGSGCLSLILFIFIIGALFWSVSTPWGNVELDIFPPALRLIN